MAAKLTSFTPKFKLKYDNLENIKTDRVSTIVFNLLQIKQSKLFFFGTQATFAKFSVDVPLITLEKFGSCQEPLLQFSGQNFTNFLEEVSANRH